MILKYFRRAWRWLNNEDALGAAIQMLYYAVVYERDLLPAQMRGMGRLELKGLVSRDGSAGSHHWHINTSRPEFYRWARLEARRLGYNFDTYWATKLDILIQQAPR